MYPIDAIKVRRQLVRWTGGRPQLMPYRHACKSLTPHRPPSTME